MNTIKIETRPFTIETINKTISIYGINSIFRYALFRFKYNLLNIFFRYKEMDVQISIDIEVKKIKENPFYAKIFIRNNPNFLKNLNIAFSRHIPYALQDSGIVEEAMFFIMDAYEPMTENTFLLVKKIEFNTLNNGLVYDYLASIAKQFFLKNDWYFYSTKEELLIKKNNLIEIKGIEL